MRSIRSLRAKGPLKSWLAALLLLASVLVVAGADTSLSGPVDRDYAALESAIRGTPAEAMDEAWLFDRIYHPFPAPQKHLKRILGAPDLAIKNERMARLRQAYDLKFWFELAKTKGWVIELTNQGKAKGHRSDLDQTGWIVAGPEANRPENFKEVQRLWEEYHQRRGIKPSQPDMTLFNGDQFLPDWKNARLASDEFITRLAGTVLELRQDSEAYYVPGANKEQVHKRALAEGRTLHIAWDHELGMPVINGKPFDLDEFVVGKSQLTYLRTEDIAVRYRGVQPDVPWRYALGNLAQNMEKFLGHMSDPIARQKYANRILNGAFAPILGITQKDGMGELQTYYQVHTGKTDPATKRDFKEQFLRQLYGKDISRNRVDELIRIFDISMDIEADKDMGRADYDAKRYYAEFMSEAAANLRQREPEVKGDALRTRALDEAERIFVQKQMRAFAEGGAKVLAYAVRRDFGPDGRLVNRTHFIGSKNAYESLVARQAERQVEIALLFEIVERIDDPSLRQGLRNNLIDTAGNSAELRKLFGQFAELGQTGREAMDDWLRASAREGKLANPEDFYKRVGDQVERVVGDLDAAAAKAPKEISLTRTHAALATTLGPGQALRRQQAIEFLKTAKGMGRDLGEHYWGEFADGLNFFFYADTASNLIRSYEQGCLNGGLAGVDCGWRMATDTASNFLWGLPYIESYGIAVTSVIAINQGDAGAFQTLTLALAPRMGIGTSVMPVYAVYKLGAGLFEISYTYTVEVLDDDLLEQALKSQPEPGKENGRRCDSSGTLKADAPAYPLFAGGPNRIPVESEQWNLAQKEQAVRAQFGPAINQSLLARGLKPGTGAWDVARREQIGKYVCQLPYYQRMAKLYEHLAPQLERYIADAAARGKDMHDSSFPSMDVCVERENGQRDAARKAAEARGKEALEAWQADEANKPSPLLVCLPRGLDSASAVLRPFMTRQVHDWLKGQPQSYQDEFSTAVERATEGNRIVGDLRRLGHALGIVEADDSNRNKLMKQLTDTLIREYLLGQYSHEKRQEFARELARQMAGRTTQVAAAERVVRAQVGGEQALGNQFLDLTVRAASERYTQPPPAIRPSLKLRLPPYPVRLGEDIPLDANVRGEYAPGGDAAPANLWKVEYSITPLDGVKEGAPPDLVITPDVARDLNIKGQAVYTLKARVVARLRDADGLGGVLAEDQAELALFDIRPKPVKAQRQDTPVASAPVNINDILDKLRQAERDGAASAQAARDRCDSAAQLARQAEADLKAMETAQTAVDAQNRALQAWLDQAGKTATEAERWSRLGYLALQSIGDARKRADNASAAACDSLAEVQRAGTDSARQQALQRIVRAVQRCKGELQAINQGEKGAKDAARECNEARQNLPPAPSETAETDTTREKLTGAGTRVDSRLAGVRTAQAQARDSLTRTAQAGQLAGQLSEDGKRRLAAETDKNRSKTLSEQMDNIVRGMERTRRAVEGCPDKVTDALNRADLAAQAAAERARTAQAQADQLRKSVQDARPLKDADASCRSAQASADTATLLAESSRVMCQDAATCQAIAEDTVREPLTVRVPNVIGLPEADARARLAQAGFQAGTAQTGDAALDATREGTVQGQNPGAGQDAAKGATVSLRVWGAPDLATLLANTDCSNLPGSTPVWHRELNQPVCACPDGTAISNDNGRCINCSEFEQNFANAINSGQLADAAGWLGQAINCPWYGNAAAALQRAQGDQQRQQQFGLQCLTLETNILAALNAHNLPSAQALLAQARQMNCPMDPSTEQFVRWAEANQPQPGPGVMPWPPQPGTGPVRQVQCNDTAKQGGNTPETLMVDLGRMSGMFSFDYEMYDVPDRMIVQYGGGTYDTGCTGGKLGAGRNRGTVDLQFFGSSQVTIQVQPSCQGGSTSWTFTVHCPR